MGFDMIKKSKIEENYVLVDNVIKTFKTNFKQLSKFFKKRSRKIYKHYFKRDKKYPEKR